MVPAFVRTIERYLAAKSRPPIEDALVLVFHLLGEWHEKSAYRPLAKLLRLNQIDSMLGDCTTETSHRVMAAVFDGDPQPLYDVILDPEADEYIRSRMCEALAMVTLRDEMPRAEATRFLRACYTDINPQDDCFVWIGWQSAIAMLGLVELKPLVEQAFRRGYVDPSCLSFEHFEEDLQRTIDATQPQWYRDEYSLFGDTIEELVGLALLQPGGRSRRDERCRRLGPAMVAGWTCGQPVQGHRPQRPVPLRQRQEIQEVLPQVSDQGLERVISESVL